MDSNVSRYFDNAATTPLDPRVVAEMADSIELGFGNPGSLHSWGARANALVELARNRVAKAIGAEDPSQVVFVANATEANNTVVANFKLGLTTPFEHSSMAVSAAAAGYGIWPHDGAKLFAPDKKYPLLSAVSVGSNTGNIWDVTKFREFGEVLHSDITQSVFKVRKNVDGLDFASLSAHKFHGPKGVGVLFARDPIISPLLLGGGQEDGRRSGTLNVTGIVGLGLAAEIASEESEIDHRNLVTFSSYLREQLGYINGLQLLSDGSGSPAIISFSCEGIYGEPLVIELDRLGYAVSSGPACSTHDSAASPVLLALGFDESVAKGAVRISLGRFNTMEGCEGLSRAIRMARDTLNPSKFK